MAAIVVEYARFVEVRQRRARLAEEFTHPPREPAMGVSNPESVDDHAAEVGVPRPDASITRGVIDVR